MYNGIGLQTARGSGTNGYVQSNLSHLMQARVSIPGKILIFAGDFQRKIEIKNKFKANYLLFSMLNALKIVK